ncbi:MAG: hypothetical protein ACFB21_06795 [Opitutales bacterium]
MTAPPRSVLLFGLSVFLALPAEAMLSFDLNFTTQAETDLTVDEQALFSEGLSFWSNILTGYRDGVSRTFTLDVDTFNEDADPDTGGVRLGSAGPQSLGFSDPVPGGPTANGGRFVLPLSGVARFNVSDDAGLLDPVVIRHEIAHALGFGTLWEANRLYNDLDPNNDVVLQDDMGNIVDRLVLEGGVPGQYVGQAALAAFQTEFGQPEATFVPVELDGGPGTAHGHWNQATDLFRNENAPVADSHPGDTGIPLTIVAGDNAGEALGDELMSGILSTDEPIVTETTIAQWHDIGYEIVTPIPEPAAALLMAFGTGLLYLRTCSRRPRGLPSRAA